MAVRTFCDRCQQEITDEDFVTFYINKHGEDTPFESWDFCRKCAVYVREEFINAIFRYEEE